MSKADQDSNATIAEMQQDAVQHLAEIEANDDTDDKEEEEEIMKPPTLKAYEPMTMGVAAPMEQYRTESTGGAQPSSESALNDDDARCYSARYQDIDALLDPKAHFSSTGIQQGRLGTCAKRLTDYEALRYLQQNAEVSRQFGRSGASAIEQAKAHWRKGGYRNPVYAASLVDKDNKPFKCAEKANESCKCPGTMWFGVATRPDNKAKIETFEEMREWKTVSQETDDWQSCSAVDFGSDPMPGFDKQCFCEVKPEYEASRCADEGDECGCNGHVYFGSKQNADKELASFNDMLELGYAILDAGAGGSTTCTSEAFKNADPAPNAPKQCFCDDRKTFTSSENIASIMDYWVEQSMLTTSESEIKVVAEQAKRADKYESEYASTVTTVTEVDFGEADATAASCQVCDRECATDTEMTLTREIEK